MSVIDLQKARKEREPHIHGVAICCSCKHEWVAVVPVEAGANWLQCPECSTMKGRIMHPVLLAEGVERLECKCGCQVFSATRDSLVCVNCAHVIER